MGPGASTVPAARVPPSFANLRSSVAQDPFGLLAGGSPSNQDLANVASTWSLLEVESRRDICLVYGSLQGKSHKAMLQRLEPVAAHRIYVKPPVPNAEDPNKFADILPGAVAHDVATALQMARDTVGSTGVVVVTGSGDVLINARVPALVK